MKHDRRILLMCDWNQLLWILDPDGKITSPLQPGSLPLSQGLWVGLDDWYRAFSEREFANDSTEAIDVREHESEGISLWKRLRAELESDFLVSYYSVILGDRFESPEALEKELSEILV